MTRNIGTFTNEDSEKNGASSCKKILLLSLKKIPEFFFFKLNKISKTRALRNWESIKRTFYVLCINRVIRTCYLNRIALIANWVEHSRISFYKKTLCSTIIHNRSISTLTKKSQLFLLFILFDPMNFYQMQSKLFLFTFTFFLSWQSMCDVAILFNRFDISQNSCRISLGENLKP